MEPTEDSKRTAAILVDAGYVWKQMARAVGREQRRDIELTRYGVSLIEALVEEAEGDGMTVLRTYWYDGAVDRVPNVQQRAVSWTVRVKLRLGSMSGGRQKGVDRLMQRDILDLAVNKAVTDLVVLTGDQDMEEELDAAGQHGLLVHLWGIADHAQKDSLAGRLLRIVDDWKVLPADWAETFVVDVDPTSNGTPAPSSPSSDEALAEVRQRLAGEVAAEAAAPSTSAESSPTGTGMRDVGRMAYEALREQYGPAWHAVREGIGSTTFTRANGERVRSIPGRYDTELMDAAEAIVGSRVTSDMGRVQIRTGFWQRLDEDGS